jgi:predicted esterase
MMNRRKKILFTYITFILVASLLLFSCNREKQESKTNAPVSAQETKAPEQLPTGLSKKVTCINDVSKTYDLYLPSSYNGKKSFPLIFIFDAHAAGDLPVNLYSNLAETFGYILMASDNSKNGQDAATSDKIYQALLSEARQRFVIDERRLYTMGFSGGARVAANVAIANGGIAGVIGCSAGFQVQNANLTNNFNFIGLAGNEDFNLAELKALDAALNETAIRHQLIVFNGKHAWCDTATMKNAFYWITFNAMRNQLIAVDDSLIEKFLSTENNVIRKMEAERNDYHLYEQYRMVVNFLDGLHDISGYKEKLDQLEHSDRIRMYEVYLNRIASEEQRLQKQYNEYMGTKDPSWWMAEVKQLNESIRSDKKPEEALFKKRLLSYMSLLAYTYSNRALASNALPEAAGYIRIYALVDPYNAEHSYLEAVLMMKYNNPGLALKALNDAVKLGFNDKERMLSEPDFATIKQDSSFNAIAQLMN